MFPQQAYSAWTRNDTIQLRGDTVIFRLCMVSNDMNICGTFDPQNVKCKHEKISGNSTNPLVLSGAKTNSALAVGSAEVLRNMSHGLMRQISGRSRLFPALSPSLPFAQSLPSSIHPSLSLSDFILRGHSSVNRTQIQCGQIER